MRIFNRSSRVVALVAAFALAGGAAAYATIGTPLVGVYSSPHNRIEASGLGMSAVNTTSYNVAGGPNSFAKFPTGPAYDTDNGSAVSGKIVLSQRRTEAFANTSHSFSKSTVNNFNLLAGKVTFDRVIAQANSQVNDNLTASSSMLGSSISNLKVNGALVSSPKGKVVPFKHNGQRIGRVEILKATKTGSGGRTTITVIGVKIVFEVAHNGFRNGQVIDVAKSYAKSSCCGLS